MTRRLWIKILTDHDQAIGPGKIALLKAIKAEGSISAAARRLEMSYSRAMTLVRGLDDALARPVLETRIGGDKRGGARMTSEGEALIALYDRIDALTNDVARDELDRFFQGLSK